jgi:hypothetical protein
VGVEEGPRGVGVAARQTETGREGVSVSTFIPDKNVCVFDRPILMSELISLKISGTLGYNLRDSLMILSRYCMSLRSFMVTVRSDPWKILSCSWYALSCKTKPRVRLCSVRWLSHCITQSWSRALLE